MKFPEILFEDDNIIGINKPSGLLSIPDRDASSPSLKQMLREKFGSIFTIHRIDRDTSGVIVFAKNEIAHKFFSQAFEERTIEKIYLGIVHGTPAETQGTIDAPLMEHPVKPATMVVNRKGKPSRTDYAVVESFGLYSLLQFRIFTGRMHQIRVHMQHVGHPVACDPVYGSGQPVLLSSFKKKFKLSKDEEAERPLLNRLGLHASRLRFDGMDGQDVAIEAPLPKDMQALLQQLRKNQRGV